MAEAFFGEIRIFGFDFPPRGWAYCHGDRIPADQNPALFSILGNNFGGDQRTYFHLPDLRGLAPMGTGSGSDGKVTRKAEIGKTMGVARVALTYDQMPAHTHQAQGHQVLANGTPGPVPGAYVSIPRTGPTLYDAWTPYKPGSPTGTQLSPLSLGEAGGTTAGAVESHENVSPYVAVNFCICISGIYPSRSD